jgi:hypothetical protein
MSMVSTQPSFTRIARAGGQILKGAGVEGASFSYWPAFPLDQYLGQLTEDYQQMMALQRKSIRLEDCRFYHCVDLPNGNTINGPWDLRDAESAYLGGVDVSGKRVLEIGPATGHLSFWMEKQGAEVVAFDAGYDVSVDLSLLAE